MALITCPACQTPQPDALRQCPNCNASLVDITVGYQNRSELADDSEALEGDAWHLASVASNGSKDSLPKSMSRC